MIFRYPEAQYKQYLTTGTCLVAFGVIMLILFSVKLFVKAPVVHYLLFIIGFLAIFPTGLTQFIRGFKHREIGYELDYSGFNIVHPEGIKTNVRWDDIKGIDETAVSIKFMTPRGQEEIYRNLENFEEFYEIFKKYTRRDLKKGAEGPRGTPVSPKPPAKDTKDAKAGEGAAAAQKESPAGPEKEGISAKKGDEARDRMLKEIFSSPAAKESADSRNGKSDGKKPAEPLQDRGKPEAVKSAAPAKDAVKPGTMAPRESVKPAAIMKDTARPDTSVPRESVKPAPAVKDTARLGAATAKDGIKQAVDGFEEKKTASSAPSSEKTAVSAADSGARGFELVFGDVQSSASEGDLPDLGLPDSEPLSVGETVSEAGADVLEIPQGGFEFVFDDFAPSLPAEKEERTEFATTQLAGRQKTGAQPAAPPPAVKEKAALHHTQTPAEDERETPGDLLGKPQSFSEPYLHKESSPLPDIIRPEQPQKAGHDHSAQSRAAQHEPPSLPKVIPLITVKSEPQKTISLPPKEQASGKAEVSKGSIPTPQDLMSSLKRIKEGKIPEPEKGAFIPPPAPPIAPRKQAPQEEVSDTPLTLSLSTSHSHRQAIARRLELEEKAHAPAAAERQAKPAHGPDTQTARPSPGVEMATQELRPQTAARVVPPVQKTAGAGTERPPEAAMPYERGGETRRLTNAPLTREMMPAGVEKAAPKSDRRAARGGSAGPATVETMMSTFVERLRELSE
jgi:hypothetical protein